MLPNWLFRIGPPNKHNLVHGDVCVKSRDILRGDVKGGGGGGGLQNPVLADSSWAEK